LINERLQGMPLGRIDNRLLGELEKQLKEHSIYKELYQTVVSLLSDGDLNQEWGKIYLDGTTNILEQPEFSDLEKVKVFLKLFEQEDLLRKLLDEIPAAGLNVVIGREIPLNEMKDCSMVVADYSFQEKTVGKMAILGPTRMEYSKVMATVNLMAGILSKVFQEEED